MQHCKQIILGNIETVPLFLFQNEGIPMTKQIRVCLDPQSQMENCLNSAEVEVKGTASNSVSMFPSVTNSKLKMTY